MCRTTIRYGSAAGSTSPAIGGRFILINPRDPSARDDNGYRGGRNYSGRTAAGRKTRLGRLSRSNAMRYAPRPNVRCWRFVFHSTLARAKRIFISYSVSTDGHWSRRDADPVLDLVREHKDG